MPTGCYKRQRLSIKKRINQKLAKEKDCWVFNGFRDKKGYGRINEGGKHGRCLMVHRYMYWYYKIKPRGTSWQEFDANNRDLLVCHKCDNPPCCNPKHLFLGTAKDNAQDALKKNRLFIAKGSDNGNSILNESQVKKIYKMQGTYKSIADKFNTTAANVYSIKKRKSWRWLSM